jgi:CTP:molybdopterin cytidylyltransferase MocA
MIVWAGVLAAGRGSRLGGRPKALLSVGGRTFLEAVAACAREGGADAVAVVLGHHAELVEPLAARVCDKVVRNPAPERGMASSARVVAETLPLGAAMLLWPVDVPFVRPFTIERLIAAAAAAPDRVVVPVHGEPGHPPLLPPFAVDVLRTMPFDARLDRYIEERCGPLLSLGVDDPGVARDVDEVDDIERPSE